jgi:hypothetical protein
MNNENIKKAAERIIHICEIIANNNAMPIQKPHEAYEIKALAEMILREND